MLLMLTSFKLESLSFNRWMHFSTSVSFGGSSGIRLSGAVLINPAKIYDSSKKMDGTTVKLPVKEL